MQLTVESHPTGHASKFRHHLLLHTPTLLDGFLTQAIKSEQHFDKVCSINASAIFSTVRPYGFLHFPAFSIVSSRAA
jgi:hypothetical protein